MKSVITKMEVIAEQATLAETPYAVEVRGVAMPAVKVVKVQDLVRGGYSVRVEVPKVDGRPILSVSTMDALARRVMPAAKVYAGNRGGAVTRRLYS